MRIIRLEAENVKRLKAVAVRPDGAVVLVGGNNGQGKSSLLDSIELALGGKGAAPPKVIREGQETARVVLETEELVVERWWKGNDKTYLEVRGKDGGPLRSPQAILDKLVSALSFDPLEFLRQDPKKQAATLAKLTGLDFRELEAKRVELYDHRRAANVKERELEHALKLAPKVDAPLEEVSMAELLAEQRMLLSVKEGNDQVRTKLARAKAERDAKREGYLRIERSIKELEAQLAAAKAELAAAEVAGKAAKATLLQLEKDVGELEDPDVSAVNQQLEQAEETNKRVRKAKDRRDLDLRHRAAKKEAERLDQALLEIELERKRALQEATMPIPGLSFTSDGVLMNELPLEQASQAEKLRVSLAMGLALNPELRVVLIRDGSLLDSNSLRLVTEMAEQADAQVWIEVVGTDRPVGVLIEDGSATGPETEHVETTSYAEAEGLDG